MNPFTKIWFWLLVISIIGFIISLIFFEIMGQTAPDNDSTPAWIWIIFILSIIIFIIAFVLYAIDIAGYHRKMEIAEACGEVIPKIEKKKIECPKQSTALSGCVPFTKPECIEKKVVECVKKKSSISDIVPMPRNKTTIITESNVSPPPSPRTYDDIVSEYPKINNIPNRASNINSNINSESSTVLPKIVTINETPDEAFSAASLKPLNSLAPTAYRVM